MPGGSRYQDDLAVSAWREDRLVSFAGLREGKFLAHNWAQAAVF
jgi:hypothetical protein